MLCTPPARQGLGGRSNGHKTLCKVLASYELSFLLMQKKEFVGNLERGVVARNTKLTAAMLCARGWYAALPGAAQRAGRDSGNISACDMSVPARMRAVKFV